MQEMTQVTKAIMEVDPSAMETMKRFKTMTASRGILFQRKRMLQARTVLLNRVEGKMYLSLLARTSDFLFRSECIDTSIQNDGMRGTLGPWSILP